MFGSIRKVTWRTARGARLLQLFAPPSWPLATLWLIVIAGCTTVETAKPTIGDSDRSAAGGSMETGNPAAPADTTVIAAADDRGDELAANRPQDQAAGAKATADKKSSTDGITETREQRLREVAADFDRRRDEAQYQAALNRWREDDAAGCREALGQLLARTPNHCPARLLLADVEMSQGSAKAALEQARQVLAVDPNSAEAQHVMGLALDALGETTAAITHYEQATRLDSQNEQYAACYHAALDASITPDAAHPENISAANRADSATIPGGSDSTDRSESAAKSGRVIQASALSPVASALPGESPDSLTLTPHPSSDSDESPGARRAVVRAADALRNNRPQEAIGIANAGLAQHPQSASLFRVLGASQYRLGNYAAAQVAIAQALSLDKSDALAYFLMGSTLTRLGEAEAAERQFAEAARLDPRFSQSRD